MIKLFDYDDIVFNTSNGDQIIETIKCNVTKGDIAKGEYYVDLEAPIKYSDILVQDKIIVVPTPMGEQPFRLNNPQKKSDKLVFKANHIFYDTKGYVIEDAYPQNMGCHGALEWVLGKTDVENPFKAYSDLTDTKNVRYVNKSLYDTICMMVNEWGGYLDVDGLTIKILSSVGEDRDVTIRYGKNLTNITAKENWNNVCTKLYAVGYAGVELEVPLVSELKYGRPYSRTVEFQPGIDVDLSDTNSIKADLEVQAAAYIQENQYPKVTYTIKSHIDNVVDIGDSIQVIHEMLNVNIITEVISYTYNSLTGRFVQIVIGNYVQDLRGVFSDITQRVEQVENVVSKSYNALKTGLEESKALINQYLTYGYKYSTMSAEYYLNEKTPEEATQFMIISLGGIGFGTKEAGAPITEAEYTTAWTLDGNFNSDCITANSIISNHLNINEVFSNSAVLNKIVSQEIFAKAITTNSVVVGASENAVKALENASDALVRATSHYGTCETAAGTATKAVTLSDFELFTGAQVTVQFTNANTAANPTLNVNRTGAKYIRVNNANITPMYYWAANNTVTFTYNGTYWVMSDTSASSIVASWCSANDKTYIDGAKIYAKSVTAKEINVDDLFAQDITATGSITGATIIGSEINNSWNEGTLTGLSIKNNLIRIGHRTSGSQTYWPYYEIGQSGISLKHYPYDVANLPFMNITPYGMSGGVRNKDMSVDPALDFDAQTGNMTLSGNLVANKITTASGVDLDTLNSNLTNIAYTTVALATNAYYRVDTAVYYKVKNGICFAYINWLHVNTVSDSWQIIASGLPKPAEVWVDMRNYFGKENKPAIGVRIDTGGTLYVVYGGTSCDYNFTISYPVA